MKIKAREYMWMRVALEHRWKMSSSHTYRDLGFAIQSDIKEKDIRSLY